MEGSRGNSAQVCFPKCSSRYVPGVLVVFDGRSDDSQTSLQCDPDRWHAFYVPVLRPLVRIHARCTVSGAGGNTFRAIWLKFSFVVNPKLSMSACVFHLRVRVDPKLRNKLHKSLHTAQQPHGVVFWCLVVYATHRLATQRMFPRGLQQKKTEYKSSFSRHQVPTVVSRGKTVTRTKRRKKT